MFCVDPDKLMVKCLKCVIFYHCLEVWRRYRTQDIRLEIHVALINRIGKLQQLLLLYLFTIKRDFISMRDSNEDLFSFYVSSWGLQTSPSLGLRSLIVSFSWINMRSLVPKFNLPPCKCLCPDFN